MRIWFYDQIGFSGANFQGQVVQHHPEHAGRWLEREVVEGDGELALACPAGGVPIAAAALTRDGGLVPVALDGRVARFRGAGRLMLFHVVERGFDYFSPSACRRLFAMVHGRFEQRVGHLFGSVIAGSFQDELPNMPTWAPDFAERFIAETRATTRSRTSPRCGRTSATTARGSAATTTACAGRSPSARSSGRCTNGTSGTGCSAGSTSRSARARASRSPPARSTATTCARTAGSARRAPTTTATPSSTRRSRTTMTGRGCGSSPSTPRAGAGRWRRRSTGCCRGSAPGRTSTTRTPPTTRRARAGGSGRRPPPTGASPTGATTSAFARAVARLCSALTLGRSRVRGRRALPRRDRARRAAARRRG